MKTGRVITYTISVILFGLLQMWAVIVTMLATGTEVKLSQLLGDGGVFFFATSLGAGSALALIDKHGIKVGTVDTYFTGFTGVVLFGSIVFAAAKMADKGVGAASPFADSIGLQIGCSTLALVYWLYAGWRTNLFH